MATRWAEEVYSECKVKSEEREREEKREEKKR
jgi:hypothetical protein